MNTYLFLAFASFWLIFFIYAWVLSRRQARLKEELEELKGKLQENPPSKTPSP